MFEEVGHFVEKIRRVGYGPLVLDQEPGNLRELEPAELDALRKAAEGKLRTPKSKDLRRRNLLDAGLLPTVLPKPSGVSVPQSKPAPPSAPINSAQLAPRARRTPSPAAQPTNSSAPPAQLAPSTRMQPSPSAARSLAHPPARH
jgi:hypothetical protein